MIRSLLVAAALATSAAVTAPAHAGTITVADPAHDVWLQQVDDGGTTGFARRPARDNGDLRGVEVEHRAHLVVIRARVETLRPARADVVVRHRVRRPTGPDVRVDAEVDPDGSATAYLTGGPCATSEARAFVRPENGVVTVVVPRRCLGRPAWVKVATRYYTATDDDRFYVDVLGNRGHGKAPLTRRVPVG